MIYGLAAALGWGLSDLWAAISGRRIGSGRTVVVAQVTAAIALSLLVLVVRPDLSGIPTVAPWLVPNAFLGAAASSRIADEVLALARGRQRVPAGRTD